MKAAMRISMKIIQAFSLNRTESETFNWMITEKFHREYSLKIYFFHERLKSSEKIDSL